MFRQITFVALLGVPFVLSKSLPSVLPMTRSPGRHHRETKPWATIGDGQRRDKTNLTKELERYAAAGRLGGIHINPDYGAKGFESKNTATISRPRWMEVMGWPSAKRTVSAWAWT